MPGPPRRYGMLTPAPAAVAETYAPSFRDVGWLVGKPDETPYPSMVGPGWIYDATPAITPMVQGPSGKAAFRPGTTTIAKYSDPPEMAGVPIWRRQAIVNRAPTQYGTDSYSLGHYAAFRLPRPTGPAPGGPPLLAEMMNSAFQPISRGGKVLVSLTEMAVEGGPAAATRRFANTRVGTWFKAWVNRGQLPLDSVQTPSPQFRGVLPTFGYMTMPSIIGG